MKRIGGVVFFYGAANEALVQKIKGLLPFQVFHAKFAAEHYGHGLKIDWSLGRNEARRRNYIAAMTCNALVVVGRPRYTTSVVTAFRQRGRRIFWWSGSKLHESEIPDAVGRSLSAMPKEATFEPEIWTRQREERERETRDYLDEHPEAQRTADSIPTFGWMEVFNEDEIECSSDDIFKRCRRAPLAELQ